MPWGGSGNLSKEELVRGLGREEFNQANAWCNLPESEFPDRWVQAIEHYESALRVRTRAKDAQGFAATVMNLGTALRQSPSADRAASVLRAVRCYLQARRIYRLDASPAEYADLCNNLGIDCLLYPARDDPAVKRHVRDAVRYFERALQVWAFEENKCQYALVQYNRGCAYVRLATREDFACAIACLSEDYECFLSRECPEIAAFARAQHETVLFPLNAQPE